MRARSYLRLLGWAFWWVGTTGCSLVAPLDGIRRDGPDASNISDTMDAAASEAPSSPDDDAGVEACRHTGTTACDPATCGCKPRQSCMWEQDEAVCYDPVAPDSGAARPGERCSNADDCRQGSICAESQVCSVECARDDDCGGGQCYMQSDRRRVCLYSCDPVGGGDCGPGTTCVPTEDLLLVHHAFCSGIKPAMRDAVASGDGEACRGLSDCEDGLGCMRTPEGIACTPWCRLHAECPQDRPLCSPAGLEVYASNIIADCDDTQFECPADQVGLCVSCEFHTPFSWTEGPVWTSAQSQVCQSTCAENDFACIAAMCPDGERFLSCFDAAISTCAGTLDGPCRSEYDALSCCVADNCQMSPDVTMCAATSCATESTAWQDCSLGTGDCVDAVAATCVGDPQ
jgi:hypothetical protein